MSLWLIMRLTIRLIASYSVGPVPSIHSRWQYVGRYRLSSSARMLACRSPADLVERDFVGLVAIHPLHVVWSPWRKLQQSRFSADMQCFQPSAGLICMGDMPHAIRMACMQAYKLDCCIIRVYVIGSWTAERYESMPHLGGTFAPADWHVARRLLDLQSGDPQNRHGRCCQCCCGDCGSIIVAPYLRRCMKGWSGDKTSKAMHLRDHRMVPYQSPQQMQWSAP
jgi:hypothetical protein